VCRKVEYSIRKVLVSVLLGVVVLINAQESSQRSLETNTSEVSIPKRVEDNVYTRNCVPCHEYLPSSLERMFMSYLKVYSGELTLKESLKAFLRNPDREFSVMSDLFLDRFGVKEKTTLSEAELKEAVDIYWDKYNIRNKLR